MIVTQIACTVKHEQKNDDNWICDGITEQINVDTSYQPNYVFDTNPLSDKHTDRDKVEVDNIKYKQYTTKTNYKFIDFSINFDLKIFLVQKIGKYKIYVMNISDCSSITIQVEWFTNYYIITVEGDRVWDSDFGHDKMLHHFNFDFKQNNTCAFLYARDVNGTTTPTETTELLNEKISTELGHSMTMLQENEFDASVWDVDNTRGKLLEIV